MKKPASEPEGNSVVRAGWSSLRESEKDHNLNQIRKMVGGRIGASLQKSWTAGAAILIILLCPALRTPVRKIVAAAAIPVFPYTSA